MCCSDRMKNRMTIKSVSRRRFAGSIKKESACSLFLFVRQTCAKPLCYNFLNLPKIKEKAPIQTNPCFLVGAGTGLEPATSGL